MHGATGAYLEDMTFTLSARSFCLIYVQSSQLEGSKGLLLNKCSTLGQSLHARLCISAIIVQHLCIAQL